MKGIVTDIQRFSVHDGPGIRTTVFLKGCNMKCAWCHNPETLNSKPQLQLFLDKCIGCGMCMKVCPVGAHKIVDGKRVFDREICTACGKCAKNCYAEALILIGREMSAEDVVKEIEQDIAFYKNSGGGVTVSGGEPAFQADFTAEVLKLAREKGIHTAVETNISMPWEHINKILPYVDLIMFDIKTMDSNIHKDWTYITNERVLENAKKLSETSIPLIIRTPVIPNVNDKEEDIRQIAGFIKDFPNLLYYELLPYHPLGTGKYESLGMKYRMEGVKTPKVELMRSLARAAREYGIEVRTHDDIKES